MKTSQTGIDLIKRFEGLELEAYQDSVGIWTIGYGHTDEAGEPRVTPGMRITEQEAEAILRRDLGQYERAVNRLVKVDLNQNEFDALVSFTFNLGAGALGSSTALKRLNAGDRAGAAEALTWWNKITLADGSKKELAGLTRRRNAEAALFLEPMEPEGRDALTDPNRSTRESGIVEEGRPEPSTRGSNRMATGGAVAGVAGAGASVLGADNADELSDEVNEADGVIIDDGESPNVMFPRDDKPSADEAEDEDEDADEAPRDLVGEIGSRVQDAVKLDNSYDYAKLAQVGLLIIIVIAVLWLFFGLFTDRRDRRR